MILPNVRVDDYYNQKYLTDEDKTFLEGYDYAVDKILGLAFSNLDCYSLAVEGNDIDLGLILHNHPDLSDRLQESIKDYFESERNMIVISMIDGMDDGVYECIKAEVDAKED